MTVEELLEEIEAQVSAMEYLRDNPEFAKSTIMHETPEYCRGALNMLHYLKTYIEHNR